MMALRRQRRQQNHRLEDDSDWITDGRKRLGPISLSEIYIESESYNGLKVDLAIGRFWGKLYKVIGVEVRITTLGKILTVSYTRKFRENHRCLGKAIEFILI